MHKGVTALQNVYFLKLCRTYGIFPLWNFLIRIPGEKAEDYRSMAGLVPKIVHFNPPSSGARLVQAHRFSLYSNAEAGYLDDISPQDWYAGLFPSERFDLRQIAYYLTGKWQNTLGQGEEAYEEIATAILNWVDVWRTSSELPDLWFEPEQQAASELTLYDTRFGQKREWHLDERQAALYRQLDDPATVARLKTFDDGSTGTGRDIEAFLADFVANGLVMREGETCLGLAVPATTKIPAALRQNLYRRYLA
jgi:hypothetical protein